MLSKLCEEVLTFFYYLDRFKVTYFRLCVSL